MWSGVQRTSELSCDHPELTWNGPDSLQRCVLRVGGRGGDQGEADLNQSIKHYLTLSIMFKQTSGGLDHDQNFLCDGSWRRSGQVWSLRRHRVRNIEEDNHRETQFLLTELACNLLYPTRSLKYKVQDSMFLTEHGGALLPRSNNQLTGSAHC